MKLLLTVLITIVTTLYGYTAYAGSTNDMVNQERLRREEIAKEATKADGSFGDVTKYKKASIHGVQEYQELIESIKDNHVKSAQSKGLIKPAPQAVIFVSFSMPSLSLKQIIQDANRYQIPVVIRGLYENSFRKTMEKIFDLVKEDNKGGVLINPVWFRKYDIKTVPAVVVSNSSDIGDEIDERKNSFDVVYGNIPLKRALTIIVDRGSATKIAKNILKRS